MGIAAIGVAMPVYYQICGCLLHNIGYGRGGIYTCIHGFKTSVAI